MIKYYTHQKPPVLGGETFKEPSLTRESDYVSLENLFEKYSLAGRHPQVFKGASELSDEEKDQLLGETDLADIQEEDLSVQKDFIDSVTANQSFLTKEVVEEKPAEKETDKPENPEKPENA